MKSVWIDTNVLIRFITSDSPDQARRVLALMRRAERGELALRVANVVIAEVVWVLASVHEFDRREIAGALRELAVADGVVIEDQDVVISALRLMESQNVAYADAYLASLALSRGEPVASFDTGFRRLGVELLELAS